MKTPTIYSMPNTNFQEKMLEMYRADDWCYVKIKAIEHKMFGDYFEQFQRYNNLGKKESLYRLTEKGKMIADFLMRMFDRPVEGEGSGIAVEVREWRNIQNLPFDYKEVVKALVSFGEMGNVPTDVQEHSNYTKVVIQDVDRALSRISFKIEWELRKRQGERYLKTKGFNDCMCWLWANYLDKIRPELREIPFQQEFVVWHS